MIIKIIYTLFLGLLITLFVGLGIDTFYPSEKMPEYPITLESISPQEKESVEQKTARINYEKQQREYQERSKIYNRNVSVISIIAAIVILVASLTFLEKIKMIADGILLGGVFTTVYGIIRGLISEDSRFRFLIVTIGLIIALVLGYIKFIKGKETRQ